jgi:hypothetical protein
LCATFQITQFWGYFLESHRIAGIWLHHRDDAYTSFQRLSVATASSVTSLAVCAVSLFVSISGTTTTTATSLQDTNAATGGIRADDWLVALYAALVSLLVAVVLAALFRHAAASADDAARCQSKLVALCVSLIALVWTAVAAFLCLVRARISRPSFLSECFACKVAHS